MSGRVEKQGKFLYLDVKKKIEEEYQVKPFLTPLASERELCDRYQVSRPTVRSAIKLLEEEKLVSRIPNKGVFYVGRKKLDQPVLNEKKSLFLDEAHISFYNSVIVHGDYTYSKVLFQNIVSADEDVAMNLEVEVGEPVFRLERLRYINGTLYCLANAYVPMQICPMLLQYDFANNSLHKVMKDNNIRIFRSLRKVDIESIDEYTALHLGIPKNSKIAVVKSITEDEDGKVVEYAINKSPAEKLHIEMYVMDTDPKNI